MLPGTDIPWFGQRNGKPVSQLFDPHCRYEGEEVAAVAADTIYQAWDAVRAIAVEYDVRENVVDVEDAMKPGAPAVREDGGNVRAAQKPYERGDVAAALRVGRRRGRARVPHAVRAAERRWSCTGAS